MDTGYCTQVHNLPPPHQTNSISLFSPQHIDFIPGAGSLTLANQLYASAPRDGTQIGTIEPGVPLDALYAGKGVRFDPLKFSWIIGLNQEVTTCNLWHGAKAKRFEDVLRDETPVGGTGSAHRPSSRPR